MKLNPRIPKIILLAMIFATCGGCTDKPAPPEVSLALRQDQDLRGAGASTYAPLSHSIYETELSAARVLLQQEQKRLLWMQDEEKIALAFRNLLTTGRQLAAEIETRRAAEWHSLNGRRKAVQNQLALLRDLSAALKDRRLATRRLVQVDIRLSEVDRFSAAGNPDAARQRLEESESDLQAVIAAQRPFLKRFADPKQIDRWRALLDESIAASRRSGSFLIVVRKVEHSLTVYRKGNKLARYDAGFGSNSLSDKLHSGDKATPEGSYQVERKLPNSKYFRALLIDYPNATDRQNFRNAQRVGMVKPGTGIGGLIEIHGGGSLGITEGCVALDNRDMALLYEQIPVGTPVLIIGTTDYDNLISSSLQQLK